MKPGNHHMVSALIYAAIALSLLCLCLEIPFLDDPPQHRLTLQIVHGTLVLSLVGALVMQQISARRRRRQEKEDNSREIEEILLGAEKNALRYKDFLECANDAIFVINAGNGQLIEMNSKGGDLFGYSREELERLHGKDLVPVCDQPLYGALVRRLARRGAADGTCITFKRKDGSRFLGEVSARLIEWEDGKVAQAIVRDITLKRQEEEEIRRRNRKLAILNSIITRVNQSIHLHKVLDLTLQETMDLFGAEGGTIHLREERGFILVAQKNLPSHFMAMMCKDDPGVGHPCLMAASRQCITLMQGKGTGCGVAQTAKNSGWQSAAGIPLFAGKRLVGVMHVLSRCEREFVADDVSFFTTMGNQLGIGIEHARMFEELNRKSEELLRSHRLLEKNSLQLKISRNRLEKNLALVERANMELERLDMMKNHFIGMVSHEFRTPLTSILSGSEFLLARHANGDDSLRRLLEMIHQSGARLNEIFNNLLKVAKLESNATSIAKTTLLLKEILDHVQVQLETVINERGQRIVRQGVEEVPFLSGNREYLTEIFMQLLENAVKFTPDGGEISITARIADRQRLAGKKGMLRCFNQHFYERMGCRCFVEVEVRDSGIGIDPDQHLKIFDKFYEIGEIRHHSTGKHKFLGKGTGLGLAIVKGMVEAHGGMIWVESPGMEREEMSGSAFFLLLPLEEDAGQVAFPFMHAATPSSGRPTLPSDGGNISENQR